MAKINFALIIMNPEGKDKVVLSDQELVDITLRIIETGREILNEMQECLKPPADNCSLNPQ